MDAEEPKNRLVRAAAFTSPTCSWRASKVLFDRGGALVLMAVGQRGGLGGGRGGVFSWRS